MPPGSLSFLGTGAPTLVHSPQSNVLSTLGEDHDMDLTVPGIILTVTGIIALIVSLTKGPNLGISRRTGVIIAVVLLVVGVVLLIFTATAN